MLNGSTRKKEEKNAPLETTLVEMAVAGPENAAGSLSWGEDDIVEYDEAENYSAEMK